MLGGLLPPLFAAGCRKGDSGAPALGAAAAGDPRAVLAAALRPSAAAAGARSLGAAHWKGTQSWSVRGQDAQNGSERNVTTTTDLTLDGSGNYHLVEENDQDGGREIFLFGNQLSVRLRYGKLIARPAREPEPTHRLEEALGAAAAAWDVVGPAADISVTTAAAPAGVAGSVTVYRLSKAAAPVAAPEPGADSPGPLQTWRRTAKVTALEGEVALLTRPQHPEPVLVAVKLDGEFTAQSGSQPVRGHVVLTAGYEPLTQPPPPIEAPKAEPLRIGQRTVLEERALLDSLDRRLPAEPLAHP